MGRASRPKSRPHSLFLFAAGLAQEKAADPAPAALGLDLAVELFGTVKTDLFIAFCDYFRPLPNRGLGRFPFELASGYGSHLTPSSLPSY